MQQRRMRGSSHLLPALALITGATFGCGSDAPTSVSDKPVAHDALVCARADDGTVTELRVLSAINHKLDWFPDFAAEVGMTKVEDCAGARAFEEAYELYSLAHPGFDVDEPRELPMAGLPAEGPGPEHSVSKISNGNLPTELGGWPRSSVVQIVHPLPGLPMSSQECSGTFIAKNWIATAAHCLPPVPGPPDQRPPVPFNDIPIAAGAEPAASLWGYFPWQVRWSDAAGTVNFVNSVSATALQYPDPLYRGFIRNANGTTTNDVGHDFALIFLNPNLYDLMLPPNPEDGSAMGISILEPNGSEPMTAAGYSTDELRLKPITTSPLPIPQGDIITTFNEPDPAPRICSGDSGGPLYTTVDIGPGQTKHVLLAVISESAGGGVGDCNTAQGVDRHRLIDKIVPYIEIAMQQWNGDSFACRRSGDFARCWGKPCTGPEDTTCTNSEVCSGSSLVYDPIGLETCAVCGVGADCSCLRGQCLGFQ